MIFSTILDWKMQADGYPAEVTSLSKKIVAGTLEVYKAAVQYLLPTPLKAGAAVDHVARPRVLS